MPKLILVGSFNKEEARIYQAQGFETQEKLKEGFLFSMPVNTTIFLVGERDVIYPPGPINAIN